MNHSSHESDSGTDWRRGSGNWNAFPSNELGRVYEAAEGWRADLSGVERPWLCWCVDDDWCIIQQQLVQACGWTPIVGTDGQVPSPTVIDGAVFVDFNARLNLPVMWMHFPLEFAFCFCERLAFWHSDVLPPVPVMQRIAGRFETIKSGEYIGVYDGPGIGQRLRRVAKGVRKKKWYWIRHMNARRWFEVVGCTTAEASRSQFDSGCGIWRYIDRHPNANATLKSRNPHWDHGVGLWYWETMFGGAVRHLGFDVEPYHYTTKGRSRIKSHDRRAEKGAELTSTHRLTDIAATLGLTMGENKRDEERNKLNLSPSVWREDRDQKLGFEETS